MMCNVFIFIVVVGLVVVILIFWCGSGVIGIVV